MNFLRKLFASREPKFKNFTVYWCTVTTIQHPPAYIDGCEVNMDIIICQPLCCIYEAHTIEQAHAMHYSDNPGTQITGTMYMSL